MIESKNLDAKSAEVLMSPPVVEKPSPATGSGNSTSAKPEGSKAISSDKNSDVKNCSETEKPENKSSEAKAETGSTREQANSNHKDEDTTSSAPMQPPTLSSIRELVASKSGIPVEMHQQLQQSLVRIEGFRDGSNLPMEKVEGAVNSLLRVAADAAKGIISTEGISLLVKASEYDDAIAKARAEGEVAGRNSNIKEQLRDDKKKSDGVPALGGTSAGSGSAHPATIFDLAGFAR